MAQLVEHNLAKVGVAGSSPVVRSIWAFSSGGERFPDTEEVRSSNLLTPTKCSQPRGYVLWAVFLPPSTPPNKPPNIDSRFVCDGLRIPQGCRQIAYVLADRDRNMLVKHNLLDSFGVSGLVLVGFVSGLTRGFYNCHAGSRVGNVLPTC